jgi:hypothetical protein
MLKLVEAPDSAGKAVENYGRPFVPDQVEDAARRVAIVEYIG